MKITVSYQGDENPALDAEIEAAAGYPGAGVSCDACSVCAGECRRTLWFRYDVPADAEAALERIGRVSGVKVAAEA